jgi:dihydrofolate synthase/folylpolyglutamate synthase
MTTLADVNEALRPYDAVTKQTMGKHITLTRSEKLMAHLGNPEQKLRIVHIAGTSGKTSTTYYIAALLTAAGCKAGSTVSPYVDAMNERIQINGQPIPEKQFAEYFTEFIELVQTAPETPTRFEVLIAFAYWVFAKEKVDYAVIETGMGGLDDSTNVAARADKVCVLTDIGYDHMEHLGDTLGKIAHQKAGIIHEGNAVFMYEQSDEIMQVLRYWVSQREDAELYTFEPKMLEQAFGDQFSGTLDLPEYQKRNWTLAYATYLYIARRDILPELTREQLVVTQHTYIPGRMDRVTQGNRTIVMDGAHNGQKMWAFAESFQAQHPEQKVPVLLALKQGKEVNDIAPILKLFASEVIVTTFTKTQDLPILSIEPSEITSVLEANGVKCVAIADQSEAYEAFIKRVEGLGVITGSFFLISQLREAHKELR